MEMTVSSTVTMAPRGDVPEPLLHDLEVDQAAARGAALGRELPGVDVGGLAGPLVVDLELVAGGVEQRDLEL